ncbi:MAG: carbonic anhydrase family protein [Pseudomonadota bacterium]|jgi:carbonic anhydrase
MMKSLSTAVGAAVLGFCSAVALADSHAPHWSYHGHEGPEYWGKIAAEFATCSAGKNQSPIDLSNVAEAELKRIEFDYRDGPLKLINNGHTVQVNVAPGSTITVNGHAYQLVQFHFHSPSEHTVEAKSFPLEAHFVHKDKDGNLAVVGVLFKEGAENAALAPIWAHLPTQQGKEMSVEGVTVSAKALLPANPEYYRYSGSLTTPPCSEGVTWLVMTEPLEVSKAQVERFRTLMGGDTNRPVQPLNARLPMK